MYTVTPEFLEAALDAVQRPRVRAEVWLSGAKLGDLPVTDGSVTIDATRSVLRSATLTAVGTPATPTETLWGWLSSPGVEVRLWSGLFVGSAFEDVPLGVFVVTDTEQADNGTIAINGSDRSIRIQRARWTDPYVIAAGTELGTALAGLLANRWTAVQSSFDNIPAGTALGTQVVLAAGADTDPWRDARGIAESFGYDLYFDGNGVARVRSIPDPLASPVVISYAYGEWSVVLSRTKRSTFERTYSGVIVRGEASDIDTPVGAALWDTDPQSPTFADGPFGQVPYFYTSSMISTEEQAQAVCASLLPKVRGRVESIAWTQLVNPAHEALDVVDVEWDDGSTSRVILDVVTVPLSVSGAMGATAREMRRY